jgi:7TMR-DISM extracellular 2/7TM diverse intracellular signalling
MKPMRFCSLIYSCLLLSQLSYGQQNTLYLSKNANRFYLYNHTQWCQTPLTATLKDSAKFEWKPLSKTYQSQAQKAHWLRFRIKNGSDSTQKWYCYTTQSNQRVSFYIQAPDNQLQILEAGTMTPTSLWASEAYDTYIPLAIAPRQTVLVYARIANQNGILPFFTGFTSPKPSLALLFENENTYQTRSILDYRKNMPEFQYRSWIQGALLLVFLFVGLLYWQYRQRIFLYYWGYVACSFLFSLLKVRAYTPLGRTLGEWPLLKTHLMESAMWWGIGLYLFFMTELLDLDKNNPKAKLWLKKGAYLMIGYGLIYLVIMLLTNDAGLQQISFWGGRVVAFPTYAFTLWWVVKKVKSPMVPYVLWANIILGFSGFWHGYGLGR